MKIFILLSIILFLPIVSAEVILDDWIPYIHDFEKNGNEYSIKATGSHFGSDDSEVKILLKKNTERYIIELGDCHKTEFTSYCFEERSFDEDEIDIDAYGQLQPALKVILEEEEIEAKLETSKTFSTSTFSLDDTAEVTIILENTGDVLVENIKVEETVPKQFEVVSTSENIPSSSNNFITNFNLYPGSQWVGTYTIKAISYTDELSYATKLEYEIDGVKTATELGMQKITFAKPYDFEVSSINDVGRREKIDFLLSLTNNENDLLTIEHFEIVIPQETNIKSTKNLKQKELILVSKDNTLSADQTEEFSFSADYTKPGTYSIDYLIEFTSKGIAYKENGTKTFEVTTDTITCYYNLSDTIAGEDLLFQIYLENSDKEVFYEIEGSYDVIGQQGTFNEPNMEKGEVDKAINSKLKIPFSVKEQTYNASIDVDFRTADNQWFSCKHSELITVTPKEKIFNIQHEDIIQTKRGSRIEVPFTLLSVDETYYEGITTKVNINPNQDIKVELDETIDMSTINHTVVPVIIISNETKQTSYQVEFELSFNEYKDSFSTIINITNPLVQEGTEQVAEEKNTDKEEPSFVEEESKNFVAAIKEFFRSIFK